MLETVGGPPRRVRRALLAVVAVLIIGRLIYTLPWTGIHEDVLYQWMGRVEADLALSSADKALAMEVVRGALLSPFDAPADPPRHLPEIFSLRDPRPVWVSLFSPGHGMMMGQATEANLYRSLRAATRAAVLDGGGDIGALDPSTLAVQIDVLSGRDTLLSNAVPWRFFCIEPGVHGIHLKKAEAEAWSPPSESIYRGWLAYKLPSRLAVQNTLLSKVSERLGEGQAQAWKEGDVDIEIFRTISVVQTGESAPLRDVFRGNILLSQIDADTIWDALNLGGQWLLGQAKEDGTFGYAYKPAIDETPDSYNVVRHAGTVFGLFTLSNVTRIPAMEQAAVRALPYLRESIKPIGDSGDMLALHTPRTRSTGAAALGLLALLEMPEASRDQGDAERMTGLGNFLLFNIDDRGLVFGGWDTSKDRGRVKKEPLYYPGEAMLALAHLYEAVKDPRYLEGAERIAQRKIFEFKWIPGGWADHWVMQGLAALARITGKATYAKSLYAMAHESIDIQYPPNLPPWPDYLGLFRYQGAVPRATRAGSRSEAIRSAMKLAWEQGAPAERFEDSLIMASKATIEQMFRPESSFWVRHPERVIGGIRGGPIDDLLRIDFNQHGLVGMLGGLEAALHQEGRPAPWEANAP